MQRTWEILSNNCFPLHSAHDCILETYKLKHNISMYDECQKMKNRKKIPRTPVGNSRAFVSLPSKDQLDVFPLRQIRTRYNYSVSKYLSCRNLKKHATGRWYFPEHTKDREKPVWSVHNTWVVSQKTMS